MSHTFIGTAGWSIPRTAAGFFATQGSQLERYASRFHAVEIDSSFYRHHEPRTYEKWAAMTPADFRFAVKLARAFTHSTTWQSDELMQTLDGIQHLGNKLGVILVQIAPSHRLSWEQDERLLKTIRVVYPGPLVLEPRHHSWASPEAKQLLRSYAVTKVQADPEAVPALLPDPDSRLSYRRLHGSPEIYASDYAYPTIQHLAEILRQETAQGIESWVVFDNTKFGRATHNALELQTLEADIGEASAIREHKGNSGDLFSQLPSISHP